MPNTGTSPSSPRTVVGRALDGGRVAGAVRQEDAVGLAGEHVGRGRGRRHHLDVAPGADEVAQDRALDPEVVRDDAERRVARRPTVYGSVGR